MTPSCRRSVASVALLAALAGCAAPAPVSHRVLVTLASPGASASDVVSRAREALAGSAVRVAPGPAVSPRIHALLLHCSTTADCDAALARLRTEALFTSVEADARRVLSPTTSAPSPARSL